MQRGVFGKKEKKICIKHKISFKKSESFATSEYESAEHHSVNQISVSFYN